jgi:hypothetical protein
MTVSSEVRKAGPYACDGVDTTFDFAFKVFAKADVRAVLTDADGFETDLTLDALSSGFSVTLNGDQDNNPGGTITTTEAHASGNTITITSDIADTQATELPAGGGWSPTVVERALDRLTILVQQVRLLVTGALRQPVSDSTTIAELPTATARANKYLKFDSNGDPGVDDSVVPSTATVSAFMETVLDDTSAAAARTTLGAAATTDLASYAPLSSPTFTGNPAAPTQSPGNNSTRLATTAFVTAAVASASALPRMYISGLTYANNSTDPTNDIDIAAGACRDATNAVDMTLSATLTKRLDAAWAVGTGNGGLDTGAIGNNDYYIWLIKRSDTGVVDALFSLSASAPTVPADYDYKRLIGWFKRVGGTIVTFTTYETEGGGIELLWSVPTLDINLANTLTTTRRTDAVKVPLNFSVEANLNVLINDGTASTTAWVYCPDQTDAAPSLSAAPLGTAFLNSSGMGYDVNNVRVRTSATGTIAARATVATVDLYAVSTMGFKWPRRNS